MKQYECGTRARYTLNKCRCRRCTEANNDYQKMRYRIEMGYEEGPTVDAFESRRIVEGHLKAGYSLRTIGKVTGISIGALNKLTKSRYNYRGARRIRRTNAAKIAEFTMADVIAAEHGFVPAPPIWSLINGLLGTGMTKGEIARRTVGPTAMSLQLGHIRVGWRSAKAVIELYSAVMGSNPYDVGQSKLGVVSSADRLDDLLRDTLWGNWMSTNQIIAEYQHRWPGNYGTTRRAVYRWLNENEGTYESRYSYEVGGQEPTRSIHVPSPY
jgi:hypothetical protein